MDTNNIRQKIEELLGLDLLAPEGKEMVISDLTENIMMNIALEVFSRLPDNAKAEYEKLKEAGDSDGVVKLFTDNIPEFEKIVNEAIERTINEYRDLMGLVPSNVDMKPSLLA